MRPITLLPPTDRIARCGEVFYVNFEGYTWPDWKLVSTHVRYSSAAEEDRGSTNTIIDPIDRSIIFMSLEDADVKDFEPEDTVWRASHGDHPNNKEAHQGATNCASGTIDQPSTSLSSGPPITCTSTVPLYLGKGRAESRSPDTRCTWVHPFPPPPRPKFPFPLKSRLLMLLLGSPTTHPAISERPPRIVDAYHYVNALGARILKDGGEPDQTASSPRCGTSRRGAWVGVHQTRTFPQEEDVKQGSAPCSCKSLYASPSPPHPRIRLLTYR